MPVINEIYVIFLKILNAVISKMLTINIDLNLTIYVLKFKSTIIQILIFKILIAII